MAETSTVSVEVPDVTMLPGRGRLLGLAQVALIQDGVEMILQGVRVVRWPDGLASVEPPCYRHTDGDLVPAVAQPEELEHAVARAVLEHVAPAGAAVVVV